MSGHQKFSNLTQNFSPQRKAKIAAKKAQLSEEMALGELRQALKISQAELVLEQANIAGWRQAGGAGEAGEAGGDGEMGRWGDGEMGRWGKACLER